MGGIKLKNIRDVLEAGARRVALIPDVTRAEDITEQVVELRRVIRSYW
jgi:thiamine monophosphate synthase